MPFLVTEDRAEIYYETHGCGEPVLLLNGIMMNTQSWAHLVERLAKDFQVILMDFRDQGRSSRMESDYSLDIHGEDVLALLDWLGIEKVHLVGLSYGGWVALRFALRHQERLATLVLANATHRLTNHLSEIGRAWEIAATLNDGEKFFTLAIPFIYSWHFYERALAQLRERQRMFKDMLTEEWFRALIRLIHSTEGFRVGLEELASIRVPTLVLGAEEDIISPVDLLQEMHAAVPGSEFVVIPGAGHGAFLEKPGEFLTCILGFIGKHPIRSREGGETGRNAFQVKHLGRQMGTGGGEIR